ncbi:MAG: DinB family protein [Flavobacteriales bacterium]|nr:DinB family protein [Flavobacteriales bacterium]
MNTALMLDALADKVHRQRARAMEIANLPAEQLLHRPAPGAWNTLEVMEHINLSSSMYVRGLEAVFRRDAAKYRPNTAFKPGYLGNWFTQGLQPGADGGIRWKMRTLKHFDPARQHGASLESIGKFIELCNRLLALLEQAHHTDLNKMRVASSLGPIIRFKAGDALRFPVAHQERHFLQIERMLSLVK